MCVGRYRCRAVVQTGSIPAHTGKPARQERRRPPDGVYPRTHGEAEVRVLRHVVCWGLSPHTRGSRGGRRRAPKRPGSIPAHTGKPPPPRWSRGRRGVYPRTHGEAATEGKGHYAGKGLSPHTRGSRIHASFLGLGLRSIPAHTGKPRQRAQCRRAPGVYPRTHGEARRARNLLRMLGGLSPHTRGSRRDLPADAILGRSIPAHTGKPTCESRWPSTTRVYPRTHGEASGTITTISPSRGLSPHTRGSRSRRGRFPRPHRSIPAHTGKPSAGPASAGAGRVYPRTHGEAASQLRLHGGEQGLSPHTRGSRPETVAMMLLAWSIPAHTGKPAHARSAAATIGVYPRTHGEARRLPRGRPCIWGLSPHTRGSLLSGASVILILRSIPAHTGKPCRSCRCSCCLSVYPRTHGEAHYASRKGLLTEGLSPHTRGSQGADRPSPAPLRSIPAHTGKPRPRPARPSATWVYPRTHGEA